MPKKQMGKVPKIQEEKNNDFHKLLGGSLISVSSHLLEYIDNKNFRLGSILPSSRITITSSTTSKNTSTSHITI